MHSLKLMFIVFIIVTFYSIGNQMLWTEDDIRYIATITDTQGKQTEVTNLQFEFKEEHLPPDIIYGYPEVYTHRYEHLPINKGLGMLFTDLVKIDLVKIEKVYDIKMPNNKFVKLPEASVLLVNKVTITGIIGNEGEYGQKLVGSFELGDYDVELAKIKEAQFKVEHNQKSKISDIHRHVIPEKDLAYGDISLKIKDKKGIETTISGCRLFKIERGYQHIDVKERFPLRYGDSIWNIDLAKINKITGFTETKDQLNIILTTRDGKEYNGFLHEYDSLYLGGYTEMGFFQILFTKLDSIDFSTTKP